MTVRWHGRKAERAFENGSEAGLKQAIDKVLVESLLIVPLEYGELQASGKAVVKGMNSYIEYGGSPCEDPIIAVVQHEAMDYKHKGGRQAKYVEEPLLRNAGYSHIVIGKELRNRLHKV